MNRSRLRRLALAGVLSATLPACQPEGAGSVHADRGPLKPYSAVADRKDSAHPPAKGGPARALPRASTSRR
jgi:hypothetical protein